MVIDFYPLCHFLNSNPTNPTHTLFRLSARLTVSNLYRRMPPRTKLEWSREILTQLFGVPHTQKIVEKCFYESALLFSMWKCFSSSWEVWENRTVNVCGNLDQLVCADILFWIWADLENHRFASVEQHLFGCIQDSAFAHLPRVFPKLSSCIDFAFNARHRDSIFTNCERLILSTRCGCR